MRIYCHTYGVEMTLLCWVSGHLLRVNRQVRFCFFDQFVQFFKKIIFEFGLVGSSAEWWPTMFEEVSQAKQHLFLGIEWAVHVFLPVMVTLLIHKWSNCQVCQWWLRMVWKLYEYWQHTIQLAKQFFAWQAISQPYHLMYKSSKALVVEIGILTISVWLNWLTSFHTSGQKLWSKYRFNLWRGYIRFWYGIFQ